MTDPVLDIRGLRIALPKGSDRPFALDGLDLSVNPGEIICLVGESGSGKSLTAGAIMRLLPEPHVRVAEGSIRFEGQDLLALSEREMKQIRGDRIAQIFQEPMTALNPQKTVGWQIDEVLRLHTGLGRKARRARVLELLDLVHIPDPRSVYHAYPHQVSGGQRQRVMIAMALANGPDLLIADEPTTALDVTIEAQILDLLAELKREETMSLLFITHDLNVVRRIADRVCVMKDGEIVETGPTAEIFRAPQHPYTQKLLAAAAVGGPDPVKPDAAEIVRTDALKVWFPIQRGFMRKTVGHVKAVDGADISVRAGETLGVVGESGSGKTTLALAIMRLISSEGRIVFQGQGIDGLKSRQIRPLRRDMQIVFQDPFGSLSPRMTVEQIVAEGLGVHGVRPGRTAREDVAQILAEVGLDPAMMHRYPHEFSGGQRQRIAIARAMILRPRMVVLDEPTSALDMTVQVQIVDLLRSLQRKYDLAYLFISHDLRVVRAMAHKVVVMRMGQIVEAGEVEAVFEAPKTDYTRTLMRAAFAASGETPGAA